MTLNDIVQLLDLTVACGEERLSGEIGGAFAADLMGDVLRQNTKDAILITGLANLQVIRTAEISDIRSILFVRNKTITPEMVELAKENSIVLLLCNQSMYKTCGELYKAGLKPIY
ncbi:MAG: hypothetical protein LBR65_01455 [Culturomica sp.]|jgi:serine kinase of HPr protein (carbohydrate metabolism regulator)|nr:hypothetical protein [Culturomica sp.]